MLAESLKQLRQRSRLTLGEWAAQSGIARSTLWRWEQGKTLPRDEELRTALVALSVSTSEQKRAQEWLQQERAARGVGSVVLLTGAGLNRNELLRALRLRMGWTQREAAARLGVNRVTLASWERGEHWPESTMLHQICQAFCASSEEVVALTMLPVPSQENAPIEPEQVVWDDIETYTGDFGELELRFLTRRAQLAQMPQPAAREREIACHLDYLHSLMLQPRATELRRELRRLATHPMVLASPALFARHKVLYATAQDKHPRGSRVAERELRSLLDLGDAVPVSERCRAQTEWADWRGDQGDHETALRLVAAALADAEASGSVHLLAVCQRQYTCSLIEAGAFSAAARSLEHFPTHTPLFAVQQPFTYAMLLHKAGSLTEAASAYADASQAARAMGMTGYADRFAQIAASLDTP